MKRYIVSVIGLIMLLFTFALANDTDKDKDATATKTVHHTKHVTSMKMSNMAKSPDHMYFTENDIKWEAGPPSLPSGVQMAVLDGDPMKNTLFTMRLKVPDGGRVAAHWHSADEHVTVVSGTLKMGMGDKFDENSLKEFPAGSFVVMKKGTRHFAMANGETVLQIHGQGPWSIHYVNSADDPRNQHAGVAK